MSKAIDEWGLGWTRAVRCGDRQKRFDCGSEIRYYDRCVCVVRGGVT